MSTKLYFFFRPKMGTLWNNDRDGCENITYKVCLSSLLQLHFIALIPSCSNSFVNSELLTNFSVGGWILKDCIKLQEKKTESRCVVLTSSPKRGIRQFHVISVVQRRLRNVSKSVMQFCEKSGWSTARTEHILTYQTNSKNSCLLWGPLYWREVTKMTGTPMWFFKT